MQVSCGDHPEIQTESSVRESPEAGWRDHPGALSAAGDRTAGREGDAGSRAHAAECSSEVQCRPYDWVSEGKERDKNSPEGAEDERDTVRTEFLGARILCEHGRLGRKRDSRIYPASGKAPKRHRPVSIRLRLTAPSRGLPHTTGSAGGQLIAAAPQVVGLAESLTGSVR